MGSSINLVLENTFASEMCISIVRISAETTRLARTGRFVKKHIIITKYNIYASTVLWPYLLFVNKNLHFLGEGIVLTSELQCKWNMFSDTKKSIKYRQNGPHLWILGRNLSKWYYTKLVNTIMRDACLCLFQFNMSQIHVSFKTEMLKQTWNLA